MGALFFLHKFVIQYGLHYNDSIRASVRTIIYKFSGSTEADKNLIVWIKAANWLSEIVFRTMEINPLRLHKAYYKAVREMGLPSQLSCSLFRTVAATYKSAKSNKRWKLAVFKEAVMPVVYNRDFRMTKKGVKLWGQFLKINDSRPLPSSGWCDSAIKRQKGEWTLILSHKVEISEPKTEGCTVGVDMGTKRLLVATNDENNKSFFYDGGALNHRRACIRRARAKVQSVGSKSSRRLLRRMSGKEAAVTEHLTHVASKALVQYAVSINAKKIVVEDIRGAQDSSRKKGKAFRKTVHQWPYASMRSKIEYKAEAYGITLDAVSPVNTSRTCHKCGYVLASNRKGLYFKCLKCGHKDDADRNASKNICARSVSEGPVPSETGSLKTPKSYAFCLAAKSEAKSLPL